MKLGDFVDFDIQFLSFYVVQVEGQDENIDRRFKHFQTLDKESYEENPLKEFLDGEFTKITKRKVDRHSKSEGAPTKIGRFVVEPGHELDSNPNYNLFHKARFADNSDTFEEASLQFVQSYVDTSAIRGGVFIVASAKLQKFFDDPFLFLLKCDFEPKVARITDESSLIHHVEMAITTKNMKSIQYPFMPEEGMMDNAELKIHQASHARYFEDFLKWVEYEKSMPEIIKTQVVGMVKNHIEESYAEGSDERIQFEEEIETWAIKPKRELQERFEHEQIMEATAQITEHTPEAELKLKLDHVTIKAMLSDFGESLHLAKVNDRYVLVIEGDSVSFEQGFSPLEFLKPGELKDVIDKIEDK